MDILIASFALALLIVLGIKEKKINEESIAKIPIRVNVNGIRGKSTITRMITSTIAASDYHTMGKTTGTAPRIIDNQNPIEQEIERMPRGVTISEQLEVIQYAAREGVEALVCECMAVNPQYQKVYQEDMIQANIGVIVNVLEDHLDLMGPTTDEIALAFTHTIPYDGKLVIPQSEYTDYFKEVAKRRNTEVFVADESRIPEGFLERFDYMVFPNNVAITLAVADALNIDEETALDAILNSNPDPGALRLHDLEYDGKHSVFVNAFPANDPESTIEIFENVFDESFDVDADKEHPIVIINGRRDRVDRTHQFIDDCIPYLGDEITLVGIGEEIMTVENAYKAGKLPNVTEFFNYENVATEDVLDEIHQMRDNRIIFCIGNIHGHGEELLELYAQYNPRIDVFNHNLEDGGE